MDAKQFVEENISAIIRDLSTLVSFKSVYSDDVKPFGSENRRVLDAALKMFEGIGLKTKNLDYYAGYGEYGSGDKLIGMIGHLDVVPAGTNWPTDPFTVVEKDGVLYGRGVTDDKGGVITCLYALKYLIDTGYKFNHRIRLIVGCNEESGCECLKHYVEQEGHIDAGFTPDAHWPGIYGEKGIFRGEVLIDTSKLIEVNGGEASNAVCSHLELKVKNEFELEIFKQFLDSHKLKHSEVINGDVVEIKVDGVAAHASLPDLGLNAISYTMEALYLAGLNDTAIDYYHHNIGTSIHGEVAGVDFKDDYGDLSFNVGVMKKVDEKLYFTIDIRFPVTYKEQQIVEAMNERFNKNNELKILATSNPLFLNPELPMIKALQKAYVDVTGDYKSKMMVIGGGTYAKGINNCIAFGPEYEGVDNHIHDINEQLIIDELKQNVLIYIQAIKNLNEIEL